MVPHDIHPLCRQNPVFPVQEQQTSSTFSNRNVLLCVASSDCMKPIIKGPTVKSGTVSPADGALTGAEPLPERLGGNAHIFPAVGETTEEIRSREAKWLTC